MPRPIPTISFGGGELAPSVYARIDLQKFGSAAKRLRDYFVHAEGGISNRPGIDYIRATKDSTKVARMITFEFNEAQSYALEFGDQYMRVYRDGGVVVETGFAMSAATQANPVVVTTAAHSYSNGEEVFISGVVGMEELNNKFFVIANVTGTTFELVGIDGTSFGAYTSGGLSERVFTLVTPYLEAELPALKFRQSNDIMYFSHRNHAPRKISRTDHDDWAIVVLDFEPDQAAPTSVSVTPQGTSGSTTYEYSVTAIGEETAEESVVATGSTSSGNATLSNTNFNRITFSAATDAESYNIYKSENGLFGFIGSTETTTFDDKNLAPDFEDTAPKLRQPFDGAGNFPGAVGLHEQRSVWGNTDNKPLNTFLSQTSQFENMNVSSPTKATDAITLRMVTGKGNEIRHFRSFRELLFVFTSGAVWSLGPGGNSDGITPSSKQLKVQEYLGSTNVPPMTIKTSMLMVSGQADVGFEINSIGEDINSGVAGNYVGSDLTVLSRHLFEGFTIKEWAYIERPYRLILCVRSDGKIICMTYLNEHQIYAFSLWSTDGEFESVCSVPEGQEDTAYFTVKRTIDGNTVRSVEKLHSRQFTDIEDAFFVDSGLTFDGTDLQTITGATAANPVVVTVTGHPYANGDKVGIADVVGMTQLNNKEYTVANVTSNTFELAGVDGSAYTAYDSAGVVQKKYTTVSGFEHLEGKTVIALADGNLTEGLTVTNGVVTLNDSFVKVHVGLSYQPLIESMPINAASQTISKRKIVKAIVMRVLDTRGIFAGTSEDTLEEYPTRSNELWGDPAETISTIVRIPVRDDWKRDSSIIVRATPGLPQTILSIVADTDIGGG
ncbi:MAG: hypothetical protein JKY93_12405 [Gammaproteobacteria bacterium]|nr:hypothetical protein [Gammaproteobacteria bacterium]